MLKAGAAEQMYQFYKTNKANLPSNISCQRDFIIDSLSQGREISAVFALATQYAEAAASQSWLKPKKRKNNSCGLSQGLAWLAIKTLWLTKDSICLIQRT